jgi:CRISPR/Cas system-associated exonuclease Cas4 (RecB family)
MTKWKIQLDNFNLILKELRRKRKAKAGLLRFDRSTICASDIAGQYYCEKKIEMEYLHGEVETEAKTIGSEAHEKMIEDAVEIKQKALWKKIYGKEPVLAVEMFILGKYQDVFLAGQPDAVMFYKGHPIVIFEFKFSKSGIAYPSYHVQAQTYGLILENMGFDTSKMFYAIVVADPKTKGDPMLQRKAIDAIFKEGFEESILSIDDAIVHFSKFHPSEAQESLQWAIEFWKQKRAATPTANLNKCANCEYQTQCQHLIQ